MEDTHVKIWNEKYRPQSFNEISGQDKIVGRIKGMVKEKNINNLLFSGPAGIGKSTIAIIIAKELFGDRWKENFHELNASDERGIDIVRGQIKTIAQTRSINRAPYRIIFLDECDALTKEAQNALRRTMENFTDNVRFLLSCNYSSKIIDPLVSRCSVFHFRHLEKDGINSIIGRIAKEEKLTLNDKSKEAIYDLCEGDARRAINILQSCASVDKNITEKLVYELVSFAEPKEISEVLKSAIAGEFIKSRDRLLDIMLKHGLSGLDSIKQIQKEILILDISDEKKAKMIEKCGEAEFRMVEGSDEYLQIESLLASFSLIK